MSAPAMLFREARPDRWGVVVKSQESLSEFQTDFVFGSKATAGLIEPTATFGGDCDLNAALALRRSSALRCGSNGDFRRAEGTANKIVGKARKG
jgi:hypothetical protein